jgi:hypothetical protein
MLARVSGDDIMFVKDGDGLLKRKRVGKEDLEVGGTEDTEDLKRSCYVYC